MIYMTQKITYEVDLSDEELTALMDRHDCPPAVDDEEPNDRFASWDVPFEAEQELIKLGEITDEETEYDFE